jgi:glutaredoxin 3
MNTKVKVYTTSYCPYCVRAKRLLQSKGIAFEEINLEGKGDELMVLKNRTGLRTVPQIFINDELIGGYDELAALDRSGKLDKLLSS